MGPHLPDRALQRVHFATKTYASLDNSQVVGCSAAIIRAGCIPHPWGSSTECMTDSETLGRRVLQARRLRRFASTTYELSGLEIASVRASDLAQGL